MSPKVKAAVGRVESQLIAHAGGSMSTQFARFIEDLWTLVHAVKRQRRKRRV